VEVVVEAVAMGLAAVAPSSLDTSPYASLVVPDASLVVPASSTHASLPLYQLSVASSAFKLQLLDQFWWVEDLEDSSLLLVVV
jgi:hypothetical protein